MLTCFASHHHSTHGLIMYENFTFFFFDKLKKIYTFLALNCRKNTRIWESLVSIAFKSSSLYTRTQVDSKRKLVAGGRLEVDLNEQTIYANK